MIRVLWAFLLRDLRHEASYKLSFLMQLAGTLHVVLIFLFLSRLFDDSLSKQLLAYGGKYFPFALIGIAVQQYLYLALNTFSRQLREAQMTGTFEATLASPVPPSLFLAGSAIYAFLLNTFHVVVYLAVGSLLGGVHLRWTQLPLVLLVLLLSACAFSCLGILSASYIVLFKKGDPLAWLFMVSASLLGGVYFPLALLPEWIRQPAAWIPMAPCLEALRGLLLQNAGLSGIAAPLGILAIWALAGLPLSSLVFRWALHKGRQTGSLGHY